MAPSYQAKDQFSWRGRLGMSLEREEQSRLLPLSSPSVSSLSPQKLRSGLGRVQEPRGPW